MPRRRTMQPRGDGSDRPNLSCGRSVAAKLPFTSSRLPTVQILSPFVAATRLSSGTLEGRYRRAAASFRQYGARRATTMSPRWIDASGVTNQSPVGALALAFHIRRGCGGRHIVVPRATASTAQPIAQRRRRGDDAVVAPVISARPSGATKHRGRRYDNAGGGCAAGSADPCPPSDVLSAYTPKCRDKMPPGRGRGRAILHAPQQRERWPMCPNSSSWLNLEKHSPRAS